MAKDARAGKTDIGLPLAVVAVLGGIALVRFWSSLPLWAAVLGILGLCAVLLLGIAMLGRPAWPGLSETEAKDLRDRARAEREGRGEEDP